MQHQTSVGTQDWALVGLLFYQLQQEPIEPKLNVTLLWHIVSLQCDDVVAAVAA